MSTEKPKLTPAQAEEVKQAAAAALGEVLDQSLVDILMNTNPSDLISADKDAEVTKGRANPPSCWVHSPGFVQFSAAADKRILRVAEQDGMAVNKVFRIHARLIPNTKIIHIKAAGEKDETAYELIRYPRSSGSWVNLFDLLRPAALTVETGYRARFAVHMVPKGSPLWPGLVIDLSQMKERRAEPKKGAKDESGTDSQSSGTK